MSLISGAKFRSPKFRGLLWATEWVRYTEATPVDSENLILTSNLLCDISEMVRYGMWVMSIIH